LGPLVQAEVLAKAALKVGRWLRFTSWLRWVWKGIGEPRLVVHDLTPKERQHVDWDPLCVADPNCDCRVCQCMCSICYPPKLLEN
jgi:hypothetical protein